MPSAQENTEEVKMSHSSSNIITPLIRSYIGKGFKYGQIFQMHPFQWIDARNNSALTYVGAGTGTGTGTGTTSNLKSKWRLILWYFNMLYSYAYAGFVVFRAYQTNQDETKTDTEKIYMQFVAVYVLFDCGIISGSLLHGEEMPAFFQDSMEFVEQFESEYFVKTDTGKKSHPHILIRILEFLLVSAYAVANIASVLIVVGYYLRPYSPEHPSSLLENAKSISSLQQVPFMILLGYFEVMYHAHCFVQLFPGLAFLMFTLVCVQKLGESPPLIVTPTTVANLKRKFDVYQAQEILVHRFNEMYSQVILGVTKVCIVMMVVLGTYCGVRADGTVSLSCSFVGFILFLVLLISFGVLSEVHTQSSAVLVSWKLELSRIGLAVHAKTYNAGADYVYLKKVFKSLRPMRLTVRKYYYIDREMLKTLIQTVVDQTVSFLLANP